MARYDGNSITAITKRLGLKGVLHRCRKSWRTKETAALKRDITNLNKKFRHLDKDAMKTDKDLKAAILQLLDSYVSTLWPVPQPNRKGDRKWLYMAQSVDAPEYDLDLVYEHHYDRIKPDFINLIIAKCRTYKVNRDDNGVLHSLSTATKRIPSKNSTKRVKEHKRTLSTTSVLTDFTTDEEDDNDSLMGEISRQVNDSGKEPCETNGRARDRDDRPIRKRRRVSEKGKETVVGGPKILEVIFNIPSEKLHALETTGVLPTSGVQLPQASSEVKCPRSTQERSQWSDSKGHQRAIGEDAIGLGSNLTNSSTVSLVTSGVQSQHQDDQLPSNLPAMALSSSGMDGGVPPLQSAVETAGLTSAFPPPRLEFHDQSMSLKRPLSVHQLHERKSSNRTLQDSVSPHDAPYPSGVLSQDRALPHGLYISPYSGADALERSSDRYQPSSLDLPFDEDIKLTESGLDWKLSSARRTSSKDYFPAVTQLTRENVHTQRASPMAHTDVQTDTEHISGEDTEEKAFQRTRDNHLDAILKRLERTSLELRRQDGRSRTLTPAAFRDCSTAMQAQQALKKYIVQCLGPNGCKDTEALFIYLYEVTSGQKVEKFQFQLPLHDSFELAWEMIKQDLVGLAIRETVKFHLCIYLLREDEMMLHENNASLS